MEGMANGIFYWIVFVVGILEPDVETKDNQSSFWPDEIHGRYNTGSHLKINKRHELIAGYICASRETGRKLKLPYGEYVHNKTRGLQVVIVTKYECKNPWTKEVDWVANGMCGVPVQLKF